MTRSATLRRRAGRPPAEITSFVGRHAELAEIGRLFGQGRLVTLTGPGGVGKTRLAIRAATELGADFQDGVCFVDLAALREPGLLPEAVSTALGLSGQAGEPLELLAEHLADLRLLLVLDTCEHLVDACAVLAEELLYAASGLRILATSRQPLDLTAEHMMSVPPLTRPAGAADTEPCDAVDLFADRAAAAVPGWSVTDDNRAAVVELCDRLDGIPLAIELVAAQVRVLTVEQILERLGDRVLEVRGRRTGLPRHQTLRAAIDWSHELCTPAERLLWARLSVFAGDFSLEGAERVCADDAVPADEVLHLLADLVGKSVVGRADRGGEVRYRMLDSLREYAAERLDAWGETEALLDRCLRWLVEVVRRSDTAELAGPAQVRLLDWYRSEQATLRTVLDHALRTASDADLVDLMVWAGRMWILQGQMGEGRYWSRKLLDLRDTCGPEWHEVLAGCALFAVLQNDLDEGGTLAGQVAERARACDDLRGLGYARTVQGAAALYSGDLEATFRLLGEAWEAHELAGSPQDVLITIIQVLLGGARLLCGDGEAAERHMARAVEIGEKSGELWCRSYGLVLWGDVLWLSGDLDGAGKRLREGLRIKRDLDDLLGMVFGLEGIAGCLITLGEPERAVRLLGAADRAREFTETVLFGPQHGALRVVYTQQAQDALGDARYEAAYRVGTGLALDDAVRDALDEEPVAFTDAPAPARQPLTRRELEIARLVADGLSNREIAERLIISKRTADSHLEHILAKLGFGNRAQVAVWITERERRG